jgi:hypothetical protein
MGDQRYTVWVGGVEVNDHYLTKPVADILAQRYIEHGYDDVSIDEIEED